MHALGALIDARMDHPDNRWSLRDVVDRAEKAGAKLGRSNLAKLRQEMTPQVSRVTIEGLAAGLGVTPLTVANAVLRSWGIEPLAAEVTDSVETVRIDPTLGERQKRELVALIQQMRAGDSADRRGDVGNQVKQPASGFPAAWTPGGEDAGVLRREHGE
jgi:hypothetical protein